MAIPVKDEASFLHIVKDSREYLLLVVAEVVDLVLAQDWDHNCVQPGSKPDSSNEQGILIYIFPASKLINWCIHNCTYAELRAQIGFRTFHSNTGDDFF